MRTLEDYLKANSESIPDKIAIICGDCRITYRKLWNRALKRSQEISTNSSDVVVLRVSQSIDFLVDYFAVHWARKVVVPLEKDIPEESFLKIQNELEDFIVPENVADILYTTGTTGKQKGTMLSHRAIIANAENLIYAQEFSSETAFIISGPLNHIGSLSKVWPTIILGGSIIITEGVKNMSEFFGALDYPYRKMATFLVPASIRMLLQFGEHQLKLYADKIDFIETGAAPISSDDMTKLCELLPNTRLYNTYASTETGIICTHNYNSNYCVAGCLGRPMKHSKLFISEEGTIVCSGETLMTGYANDEELTRKVLHDGCVYTNDKGFIDSEGRLQLSGREDDIINVGGYKVNPIEVENVVLSLSEISDCICIADKHPVLGVALRLLVVIQDSRSFDKKQLAHILMDKLERYKVPQLYTQVESIKRTYNGKLDRKYYRLNLS